MNQEITQTAATSLAAGASASLMTGNSTLALVITAVVLLADGCIKLYFKWRNKK